MSVLVLEKIVTPENSILSSRQKTIAFGRT